MRVMPRNNRATVKRHRRPQRSKVLRTLMDAEQRTYRTAMDLHGEVVR